MPPHVVRLIRAGLCERPAFDTALSAALLRRSAEGSEPETLRIHRSAPSVAFGRRDVLAPGYASAARAARAAGFAPIQRLAGGRAVAFHEGTIGVAWTVPDLNARTRIEERFVQLATILCEALGSLGVDARIGEVPGEYCPGAHSVNARDRRKIVGIAQRIALRSAHVGGVLVVSGTGRTRQVLTPVYRELGLQWDPETVGSVADERGPTDLDLVERVVIESFAKRYTLEDGAPNAATLELAHDLEKRFECSHGSP